MTIQHLFTNFKWSQLAKRAIQGTGIALVLLSILLIIIGEVASWIYIPLLTVSIGGACGGIFYYLFSENILQQQNYKILINSFCAIVFIIGFWLSLVFGLAQVGLWD